MLLLLLLRFNVWISKNYRTIKEKAMAPHSSTLAWKIPWMEEPGGLYCMWSLRVRHDWATSLLLFTFRHWRGRWQPTPVFLPGESQGRGSLVGFRLWGRTERTQLKQLSSSSSKYTINCYFVNEIYPIEPIYGEGNGNPLQYSCLENPVDRGAWWAAVHRVAQSQTRLKRLSMHACMSLFRFSICFQIAHVPLCQHIFFIFLFQHFWN